MASLLPPKIESYISTALIVARQEKLYFQELILKNPGASSEEIVYWNLAVTQYTAAITELLTLLTLP
jgi:hypothetical protein